MNLNDGQYQLPEHSPGSNSLPQEPALHGTELTEDRGPHQNS